MRFVVLICVILFSHSVWAGSTQPQEPIYTPEEIASFSKEVERYAASRGARVFIIARKGRPDNDMPRGIQFSHTAIAIYSQITLDDGQKVNGYAIHNLYQDGEKPGISHLITDYPVDFFWSAYALEAGILIPSTEMQTKLLSFYSTNKAPALHNGRYSIVANPYNRKRQNCTEYTLDILTGAIYDTTDTVRIKRNVNAYFDAQKVNVSRGKLALGSWFNEGITLSDHDGAVQTATFGSIGRFLKQYNLLETSVVFAGKDNITPLILGE